jgi:DNA-binding NarL/FixJ family response regulator
MPVQRPPGRPDRSAPDRSAPDRSAPDRDAAGRGAGAPDRRAADPGTAGSGGPGRDGAGDGYGSGVAPAGPTLVLVALSSPEQRRDVAAELAGAGGFGRVVHAAPADVATAAGATGPGELAVVEWGRDDPEPVDVVAALRRAGWPHVVVVGAGLRTATVVRALTTGAQGYLVAAVPAPERPRPPSAVPPSGARPSGAPRPGPGVAVEDVAGRARTLSRRELQVLTLTADGLSNGEIARELGLSALTVKSHLSRMTRRLGARDRAHLVLLAMRAGVLS